MTNPGSKRFCMNGSAANSWIPCQSGVRGSRIDDSSLTKVSRRTPLRQFFLCTLYNYTELCTGESQGAINEYPFDFIADSPQAFESLFPPFRLHHRFARPFTLHQRKGRWGSTRPVNGTTPMVDEGISTLSMWYIIGFPWENGSLQNNPQMCKCFGSQTGPYPYCHIRGKKRSMRLACR